MGSEKLSNNYGVLRIIKTDFNNQGKKMQVTKYLQDNPWELMVRAILKRQDLLKGPLPKR